MRKDAATQEGAKLALDERGQAIIGAGAREKGLELLLQDGVQDRVLGLAAACGSADTKTCAGGRLRR